MTAPTQALYAKVAGILDDAGVDYTQRSESGAEHLILELPGEKKLKTTVLLSAGHHGLRVEAFVCRRPDENHEHIYRYLLSRNRRLYGVAYTIDSLGDIYLTGRLAAESVTADEIDRILGQVLAAADGDFNTLLELGFVTAIRREWAWRVSRGESLRNLLAFEHLIDKESLPEPGAPLDGEAPAPVTEAGQPDGDGPGRFDDGD